MNELQESKRVQEEIYSALEEQRAAFAQQKVILEYDQELHAAHLEHFEQALGSVRRDRESMRTEVQTLSTQLTDALKQVGNLNEELEQTRRMIPSVPTTQPPVMPQMIPPETRFPSYVLSSRSRHSSSHDEKTRCTGDTHASAPQATAKKTRPEILTTHTARTTYNKERHQWPCHNVYNVHNCNSHWVHPNVPHPRLN